MAEVRTGTLTSLLHHTKVRKNCVEPITTAIPQHLYQSEMKCHETKLPQIFVIGAQVPKVRTLKRQPYLDTLTGFPPENSSRRYICLLSHDLLLHKRSFQRIHKWIYYHLHSCHSSTPVKAMSLHFQYLLVLKYFRN